MLAAWTAHKSEDGSVYYYNTLTEVRGALAGAQGSGGGVDGWVWGARIRKMREAGSAVPYASDD